MFRVIEGGRFIDLCVMGHALPDDVDDYVDDWHDSESDVTISEYLGMSSEEYESWVHAPETLNSIITARITNVPLISVLKQTYDLPMAARASSPEAAKFLMKWLKTEDNK
ncbi:hypothetical protein H5181_17440 [Shewanella sp. SG44-2]|jgi:hypothetical protein|uniref:hypothetical protein n=1 Tax=Shewanella sp. SG44-2 TaxID=2760962 RepID=UPI0016006487|nr:hypothetical protein [Shewanella sp. SG44-2]MBB1428228.1 hypothetical protein [Shewanella sp. SG44-2]